MRQLYLTGDSFLAAGPSAVHGAEDTALPRPDSALTGSTLRKSEDKSPGRLMGQMLGCKPFLSGERLISALHPTPLC